MVRTFTAAVHEEDAWYVARCLELDVASATIKCGTLASILRQAGLTPAEFLKLLK